MRTLQMAKHMVAYSSMLRLCSLQGSSLGKRWFSSSNSITDMTQVRDGTRYFQEKMMNQAIQHLQRSLTILPFYIKDSTQYNIEFDDVVNRLLRGYVWKGQTEKIEALSSKVMEESLKLGLKLSEKSKEVCDVLSIIGKGKATLHCDRKQQIQDNYKQIISKGKDFDITKCLVSPRKSEQQNTIDLSPYIHSELRSSTAFIYTSLLTHPSFPINPQYNKLCNTLLKGAEKSSQKNIIKPLSILVTNLLRNKQYLQAQGMIHYCLDRKRQNIKLNHLRQNQQFILLHLFLSQTYEGVDRHQQSKRIHAEYSSLFCLQTFMLQHFLIDSI